MLTINAIFTAHRVNANLKKSNKSTTVKCFYTAAGGTKTTALTVLTELSWLASLKRDDKTLTAVHSGCKQARAATKRVRACDISKTSTFKYVKSLGVH